MSKKRKNRKLYPSFLSIFSTSKLLTDIFAVKQLLTSCYGVMHTTLY